MTRLYQDEKWLKVQVDKYKTGAEIARQFNFPVTCVNRYIRKYNLIKRSYTTRVFKNTINEDYFKNINSEEKAYWLGFIMADGCIYKQKRVNGFSYSMPLKLKFEDIEHLYNFKKCVEFSGKINLLTQTRLNIPRKYAELKVNNNNFCNNLILNGVVERKTGLEHIPDTIPNDLRNHFIRGYFDGDGSVGDYRINICCGDRMSVDLSKILESLNIVDYKLYHDSGVNVLTIFNKENRIKFMHYMYDNSSVYLSRKYDKVKKVLNKYDSPLLE